MREKASINRELSVYLPLGQGAMGVAPYANALAATQS